MDKAEHLFDEEIRHRNEGDLSTPRRMPLGRRYHEEPLLRSRSSESLGRKAIPFDERRRRCIPEGRQCREGLLK